MESDLPILKFNDSINFWLIRANGGKYYDDFINNEYVGIKYNLLTIAALKELGKSTLVSSDDVRNMMFEKYNTSAKKTSNSLTPISKTQLTLHARQTYDFTFNVKIGDIVLTPAKRSHKFAIGVIMSEPYDASKKYLSQTRKEYENGDIQYLPSEYSKRRDVFWLHVVGRKELPKELIWIINAHQAITELDIADKSKLFNLIAPLYKYNEKYYLRLYTSRGDEFSLDDWSLLVGTSKLNTEGKVDLRADINSPGFLTYLAEYASDIAKIAKDLGIPTQQLWYIVIVMIGGKKALEFFAGKDNLKKKGLYNWLLEAIENFWKYKKRITEAKKDYLKSEKEHQESQKGISKDLDLTLPQSKPVEEKNDSKLLNLFSDDEDKNGDNEDNDPSRKKTK